MRFRRFDERIFSTPMSPAEYKAAWETELTAQQMYKQHSVAALKDPHARPQRRIQLWESLHGLHLPKSADHPLIEVVAQKTALSIEEVRAEQTRRHVARIPAANDAQLVAEVAKGHATVQTLTQEPPAS